MKLTTQQDTAINMMLDYILSNVEDKRFDSLPKSYQGQTHFVFAGYAGTGKTTTVESLISSLEQFELGYKLLAPTHRACKVLAGKTKKEVATLHATLYKIKKITDTSIPSSVFIGQEIEGSNTRGMKLTDRSTGINYLKIHGYIPKDRTQQGIEWYIDSVRKAENYMKRKKLDSSFKIIKDPIVEELEWELKNTQDIMKEIGTSTLIIDESSMVRNDMQEYLAALPNPVIFIGDGAQLPPIYKTEDPTRTHLTDTPDIELTEVLRSAEDTGIALMGEDLRKGKRLDKQYGSGAFSFHMKNEYREWGAPIAVMNKIVDHAANLHPVGTLQFLATTRKKVAAINEAVRAKLGFSGCIPQAGERLIATSRDASMGIQKNEILTVIEVMKADTRVSAGVEECTSITALVETEEGGRGVANMTFTDMKGHLSVMFAYCITTHRSQGSSFRRVVWANDAPMRAFGSIIRNLAYTGATRAEEIVLLYTWDIP